VTAISPRPTSAHEVIAMARKETLVVQVEQVEGMVHFTLLNNHPTIGQECKLRDEPEDAATLRHQRDRLLRMCEELMELEPPDADLTWYSRRVREILRGDTG
jgi:hypothetical protein